MSLNVVLGSPTTAKQPHSLPKHCQNCQTLSTEDCDIRMEFGEMMLAWFKDWPDLLKNFLWIAEAVFHIGGFVNCHNCYYWAEENPRVTSKKCRIDQS